MSDFETSKQVEAIHEIYWSGKTVVETKISIWVKGYVAWTYGNIQKYVGRNTLLHNPTIKNSATYKKQHQRTSLNDGGALALTVR